MTQQPLNTHLFIQRLVHLVVSDPFESEATEEQVKALSQQYARDKFARLPQDKRAAKLRDINAALHRDLPTALYHKAHVTVEAALTAPLLQPPAKPAGAAPPAKAVPPLPPRGHAPTSRDRAPQEREQIVAAREAAVQEREDAVQTRENALQEREQMRENALQEREQMVEAQAASLSTWENELKALRDALAEAGGVV